LLVTLLKIHRRALLFQLVGSGTSLLIQYQREARLRSCGCSASGCGGRAGCGCGGAGGDCGGTLGSVHPHLKASIAAKGWVVRVWTFGKAALLGIWRKIDSIASCDNGLTSFLTLADCVKSRTHTRETEICAIQWRTIQRTIFVNFTHICPDSLGCEMVHLVVIAVLNVNARSLACVPSTAGIIRRLIQPKTIIVAIWIIKTSLSTSILIG
jgi:hypothetical protein